MFQVKVFFSFAVLLMLFMHQLVQTAPTANRNSEMKIRPNRTKRGVTSTGQPWADAVVPYELATELNSAQCLVETFMMDIIMLKTCVFFRPRRPDDVYSVRIHKGDGYYAAGVGQTQSGQISLGSTFFRTCLFPRIVLHELMHTLGFHHEHQRSERDQYVKVNYDNIEDSRKQWFNQNQPNNERTFGEFDFDSIMHYDDTAFGTSWNKVTIEPVVAGKRLVKAKRLSPLDIKSINTFYQCDRVDKRACEKMDIFYRLFPNCFFEASNVLHWSFIEPMERQCKESCK